MRRSRLFFILTVASASLAALAFACDPLVPPALFTVDDPAAEGGPGSEAGGEDVRSDTSRPEAGDASNPLSCGTLTPLGKEMYPTLKKAAPPTLTGTGDTYPLEGTYDMVEFIAYAPAAGSDIPEGPLTTFPQLATAMMFSADKTCLRASNANGALGGLDHFRAVIDGGTATELRYEAICPPTAAAQRAYFDAQGDVWRLCQITNQAPISQVCETFIRRGTDGGADGG